MRTNRFFLIVVLTALMSANSDAAGQKVSVSGTIIDPFNGKAVEQSTVYIKGTAFSSQRPDGKFKFEGIEPGSYTLEASKSKYSKWSMDFTISKPYTDMVQNVYIYSQTVAPGLYRLIKNSNAEKITNDWTVWQSSCKGKTGFALRTKFESEIENPKTKKKEKKEYTLPMPKNVPLDIDVLYKTFASVRPVDVFSYPVISSSAKNHTDCLGVDEKETLLIPDMSKGIVLPSGYVSDNLSGIKGTLLKGKQFFVLVQEGKPVGLYYLNAQ